MGGRLRAAVKGVPVLVVWVDSRDKEWRASHVSGEAVHPPLTRRYADCMLARCQPKNSANNLPFFIFTTSSLHAGRARCSSTKGGTMPVG